MDPQCLDHMLASVGNMVLRTSHRARDRSEDRCSQETAEPAGRPPPLSDPPNQL